MGDRANVRVIDSWRGKEESEFKTGSIYLYTHWLGTELPQIVQEALKRRIRWDDAAYLARIVFCQMVKGAEELETGFGIFYEACDGEDRIVELKISWDWQMGKGEQQLSTVRLICGNKAELYTFEEFCALENPQWPGASN